MQTWVREINLELDLIEKDESQIAELEGEIESLYESLDPEGNLRSIPGVGRTVAPVLLAAIGDVGRFHNAKAFRQWTGVIPRSHQSSGTRRLGMPITKAGPARVKRALYQASECARRWDPQLASIYFRQMVGYGKTHEQAMGSVMSHLATRVYTLLEEKRPYQLLDVEGSPVRMAAGRQLIRST